MLQGTHFYQKLQYYKLKNAKNKNLWMSDSYNSQSLFQIKNNNRVFATQTTYENACFVGKKIVSLKKFLEGRALVLPFIEHHFHRIRFVKYKCSKRNSKLIVSSLSMYLLCKWLNCAIYIFKHINTILPFHVQLLSQHFIHIPHLYSTIR